MIPVLNRIGSRRVDIPAFSGGINMRDGARNIRDNQLTESVNLWYKDGALRTRPSFVSNNNMLLNINALFLADNEQEIDIQTSKTNTRVLDDKRCFLEVIKITNTEETIGQTNTIEMSYRAMDGTAFNAGLIQTADGIPKEAYNVTCLVTQFGEYNYVYVKYFVLPASQQWKFKIFRIKFNDKGLVSQEAISAEDIYVPLALTNGVPVSSDAIVLTKGTQVEGYNLLSRYYRMEFSSYNPESNLDSTPMEFALNFSINDIGYVGCKIIVKRTDKYGSVWTHTATIKNYSGNYEAHEEDPGGDIAISVKNNILQFRYMADDKVVQASKNNYLLNDIEVTAPCYTEEEYAKNFTRVANMTQAIWFGSTALGINGGSRLFLGGSASDPALVLWSDLENPLYFSENNYAYVGDKGQRVVAFGAQASNLIILKEREIYATQYVQGDVTAEELTNQAAIDITTRLAQFPVSMVHQFIGCDSPNTVQLCRNRLVWAYDHNVYTLAGANQYSERNVFKVSDMISAELAQKDFKNAFSADWLGKYLLFIEKDVYALDYDSYGYANVASYTKNEDANLLMPWYKWVMPIGNLSSVVSADDEIMMFNKMKASKEHNVLNWSVFDVNGNGADVVLDGNADIGESIFDNANMPTLTLPIECTFTTKQFDLGAPNYYKSINSVYIESECSTPISLEMHTERKFADKGKLNKATRHFIPYMRLNRYFALKIACSGIVEIKGMTINYKTAGVVR